jgi:hypothetical protein
VLLSAFAAGSWIGQFLYGLARTTRTAGERYPALCLLAAAGLAPLILIPSLPVMVVLDAVHHHHATDPGEPLQIRARISGIARRLAHGWRLRHLEMELVWTHGDPPASPA